MVDKRSIEGSSERAADRGRDMFDPIGDSTLGSYETVDGLVRQFLGEIVDTRKAYHEDKLEGPQASEKVQEIASKYAAIFMGKDASYGPTAWNSPEQLGEHLLAALEGKSTSEAAAADYLLRVASDFIVAVSIPIELDELDDETAQFRIEATVEDCVYALLGIRQDEPEE